ncbi:DUF488 domain-containing protein [Aquifex sp.]
MGYEKILYTVGYSSFSDIGEFVDVLKREKISLLVDVRSFPFSQNFSSFNKGNIENFLKKEGIAYIYLGDYLGGEIVRQEVLRGLRRVEDLLKNPKFRQGMRDLFIQTRKGRTAIMCSEKYPYDCHRFLSIGYLFKLKANYEILNIVGEEIHTFEETIEEKKKELKLENVDDDYLMRQLLVYIYKVKNKKEVEVEALHDRLF